VLSHWIPVNVVVQSNVVDVHRRRSLACNAQGKFDHDFWQGSTREVLVPKS
jgi:hypothetical protein